MNVRFVFVGLAACGFTLGCGPTVILPPVAPANPRPVFVLDHGRHASLVLPVNDSTVVRYSYGDWRWYALQRTGVLRGSSAALWPTKAALGRRELASPAESGSVRRAVRVTIEQLHEVVVEADAIRALSLQLDSLYQSQAEHHVYNAAYDLDFVPHPTGYWVLHNSNQVVARWLVRLGCVVHGPAVFSSWRVRAVTPEP